MAKFYAIFLRLAGTESLIRIKLAISSSENTIPAMAADRGVLSRSLTWPTSRSITFSLKLA
jgi:hypothetical protein